MIDDLATTIAKISTRVPGGILIFFPSYKVMNDIYERWTKSGGLHKIQMIKKVLKEPSNAAEYQIIIDKLKNHLTDDGRLYIIGMNPIPDNAPSPADLICELRKARDACILLAGHRPYREFPIEWMARHLKKSNMKILKSKNFTILHSEESAKRQLKVAQSKLSLMAHNPLRAGMESYLNDLNTRLENAIRSTERKKIPLSFDYVICAEIEKEGESEKNVTVFNKMELGGEV
jgi:hypothetical protein